MKRILTTLVLTAAIAASVSACSGEKSVAPTLKQDSAQANACSSYYVRWGRDSVLVQGCE